MEAKSEEVHESATGDHTDPKELDYIDIRDLGKVFGSDIVACDDISLSIDSDEFVVFLGPSGCGKTTTLRCIAGLEQPDSGEIFVQGEEVSQKKPKDRDLAFVFQDIALYPHMSVKDNISFGLDMTSDMSKSEKEDKVREAAEILEIEEMLDRQPNELSGGQQQRVSLGRAMVMEPKAFLLDEPFAALDANLRDRMRVEIKKLQRRLETTMIFVTHDQEEAMTLGDKIVIMNDGAIQQVGTPHEIYNDPTNQFVASFIGSPSTNMLECDITDENGQRKLKHEQFELPLSAEQSDVLDRTEQESVTLGVRPEQLHLTENLSEALFTAEIEVIEPRGDNEAVYLTSGSDEITAVTSPGEFDEEGIEIGVDFSPEEIWLFDRNGERIL